MRHYPATRHELNQLAENHQAKQIKSNALDEPPGNFMQVLTWLDDVAPTPYPSNEAIRAAQALPPTATLADVLKSLGCDLSDYGR